MRATYSAEIISEMIQAAGDEAILLRAQEIAAAESRPLQVADIDLALKELGEGDLATYFDVSDKLEAAPVSAGKDGE